jgi:hypothetical protein
MSTSLQKHSVAILLLVADACCAANGQDRRTVQESLIRYAPGIQGQVLQRGIRPGLADPSCLSFDHRRRRCLHIKG